MGLRGEEHVDRSLSPLDPILRITLVRAVPADLLSGFLDGVGRGVRL